MAEPAFLGGFAHGKRFGLWLTPPPGVPGRGAILCVQPFGDEATLARRVIVAQARRLAELGWTTLVVDPFGTGDSSGETREATLDQWRADLMLAASIARARAPGTFVLWGVRMGALLACEMLPALDQIVSGVVFWQPAPTGEGLLAPLMKLASVGAVARAKPGARGDDAATGAMDALGAMGTADAKDAANATSAANATNATNAANATNAPAQSTRSAPAQSNDPLDTRPPLLNLGGYQLRLDLIEGLSALTMRPPPLGTNGVPYPVLMLGTQRVLRPNAMAPLWLADLAQQWLDAGHLGSLRTVQGEPFWASLEPSTPVAAFEATEAFLAKELSS